MGVQKWGALGGFQKKTGPAIGRWLKGQNVIVPLPHPSQNPPSEAQLNQRARFGLMVSWLRVIKGIIRLGFTVHKEKESPWNAAVSYNLEHAISGVAPNFTIDFAETVLCRGELDPPYAASVTSMADEVLKFEWQDLFNPEFGAATDTMTLVTFNPAKWRFVYLSGVGTRGGLTFDLQLPADFAGDEVHCWISVASASGKQSSDSVYLGIAGVL